jgi:hypothetical protein
VINLFLKKLSQKLNNLGELSNLDKDFFRSLKKFSLKIQFNTRLQSIYDNYDPNSSFFHIQKKIPLSIEVFETWMNKNPSPKVLVEKIISDISSCSGNIQNKNVEIYNKNMDEIARFLEFESGVSTAVCFSKGEIFIALNKCSEKFPLFKEMCYDFFKFLKLYAENPFLKDEKELTISFILQSYRNSRSPSVEDEKKL